MAATSKNKYDVYTWIIKVIQSCETTMQLHIADKLIRQYSKQYYDLDMLRDLHTQSECQLWTIMDNIKTHKENDR